MLISKLIDLGFIPEIVLDSTIEEEKNYCRSFRKLVPKVVLYFKNPLTSSVWEGYTEEDVRDMMLEFMEFGYDECFEEVEKLNSKKTSFTIILKDYSIGWTDPPASVLNNIINIDISKKWRI